LSSTQVRHPWRATLRSVVPAVVTSLPLVPAVVAAWGAPGAVVAGGALGVFAALARVLTVPGVIVWLERWVPALAPAPPGEDR
jgi:hypothetical protein